MGVESVNYQCPACGGPLRYDGAKVLLVCDHCDSEFALADIEARYAQKQGAAEEKAQTAAAGASDATGDAVEAAALNGAYVCSSCGAELVCDDTTAVSECPYCGNPVVAAGRFAGEFRPDLVIPFKLDRKAAEHALAEHYQGKILLPKSFAGGNRIKEVQGVYVPFWLMDADATGKATFEATRTRRYPEGDDEVIETDHFDVVREGSMSFTRIPVDGSSKMPDAHMDAIEPFDYSALVPYSVAYMPGFVANRYDEDAETCRARAKGRIDASVRQALEDTVEGYDTVACEKCKVEKDWADPAYALMPVWMLGTMWEGEQFLFAMNGQTGRLVGDLPVDKKKRTLIGAGVFAALFAFCFAAVNFGGFLAGNAAALRWGFMLALPLLVALVVCAVLTGQMQSAIEATEADRYLDAATIDITRRQDAFTHTTTERIHHEKGEKK